MYSSINFKTKKQLRTAIEQGEQVGIFQPEGLFNPPEAHPRYTGKATLEGPHYPQAHTWYASVELLNGLIVKVR
jgi:hypothetical protein